MFAASSPQVEPEMHLAARELGLLMAQRGWDAVTGAGSTGLMRSVADGVLDAGGWVTGVIPKWMVDKHWDYDRLPEMVITADMHERTTTMAQLAQAFIAVPGGLGTIQEIMEMSAFRQLKLISHPIVLLNVGGFYDPLLAMFRNAVDHHLMAEQHLQLCVAASTPAQALDLVEQQLAASPIVPAAKR